MDTISNEGRYVACHMSRSLSWQDITIVHLSTKSIDQNCLIEIQTGSFQCIEISQHTGLEASSYKKISDILLRIVFIILSIFKVHSGTKCIKTKPCTLRFSYHYLSKDFTSLFPVKLKDSSNSVCITVF